MGYYARTIVITFLCSINFKFRFIEQIKDTVYNLPLWGRGTARAVDEVVIFDKILNIAPL